MVGSKLVIKGGAAGTTWHAVDEIAKIFDAPAANNRYEFHYQDAIKGTYHLERIAFLGDSITYAAISTNYKNNDGMMGYPKQTGRMDWKECVVKPYGSAGTELNGYMNIGLWTTFKNDSAANNYDVVVIMLGINDANVIDKAGGWKDSDDAPFVNALKAMIQQVAAANPNAEIVIMTCCTHFRVAGNAAGYVPIASSVRVVELQKATAQEMKNAGYKVHLYDMDAFTTDNLTAAMFNSDLLHPNDLGHERMAEGLSKALAALREGRTDPYLLY
jgi:lysophospholipase L1-like esterase